MRRTFAGLAIAGMISTVPAVAAAQTSPPTTVERSVVSVPVNSTQRTTVTSIANRAVTTVEEVGNDADKDDDDDGGGKWGLLGLLGLLGLAGLAGLRRRRDDGVDGGTTRSTVRADTTPRGSTSGDTH